jgi:hypothetical protein
MAAGPGFPLAPPSEYILNCSVMFVPSFCVLSVSLRSV